MLAVDERGEPVDGDQILAVLALSLGVDRVAVTVMTNLGFHRLMAEHRVKVVTTPVGDRYVLEALRARRRASRRRAVRPPHLARRTTSPATGSRRRSSSAARCAAARLSEATAVMPRYPQVKRNIHVSQPDVPQAVLDEVDRLNDELGETRARPRAASGTEPVVRVLAEAENAEDAEKLCASIAALVERELG